MGSLRNRLLIGASLVITFGILISDAVIYSQAKSVLFSEFDDSLSKTASAFSNQIEFGEDGLEIDLDQEELADFEDDENPVLVQVWREDTSVMYRSARLQDKNLEHPFENGTANCSSITLPDGAHGRQVAISFFPKIEDELLGIDLDEDEELPETLPPEVVNSKNGRVDESLMIVVAASTHEIDALISKLFWLLVIVAAFALAISLSLILMVVSKSLRPLRRVADDIESIDEESLDHRIDTGNVPQEVLPIVKRLNDLLGRVDSVLTRERAFSSDVSHELRTPLAGIKSTIEVCLSKHRGSADYQEALADCLKICTQSQRMVESLLAISHLENGMAPCQSEIVDLPQLINDCWQEFEAHANYKCAQLTLSVEPISLDTDKDKFRVVMRNLIQNAVSHCDANGQIRISSICTNGSVQISIENTGNKIAESQIPLIFNRFWRGDNSRSETGSHFGLGLSLVKSLVAHLRGQILVAVSGSNFRAAITLPIGLKSNECLISS